VQLEEVVSVFNRRLGHLESDITNLLTQLAAQQRRDSGEPGSKCAPLKLQPRSASRPELCPVPGNITLIFLHGPAYASLTYRCSC
jgi:hypothetical protein